MKYITKIAICTWIYALIYSISIFVKIGKINTSIIKTPLFNDTKYIIHFASGIYFIYFPFVIYKWANSSCKNECYNIFLLIMYLMSTLGYDLYDAITINHNNYIDVYYPNITYKLCGFSIAWGTLFLIKVFKYFYGNDDKTCTYFETTYSSNSTWSDTNSTWSDTNSTWSDTNSTFSEYLTNECKLLKYIYYTFIVSLFVACLISIMSIVYLYN